MLIPSFQNCSSDLTYLDCRIPGIISEEGTYVFVIILRDAYMMMLLGCTSHVFARTAHPCLCSDSTNAGLAALNLSQLPNEAFGMAIRALVTGFRCTMLQFTLK
jgi:hypothetical protein